MEFLRFQPVSFEAEATPLGASDALERNLRYTVLRAKKQSPKSHIGARTMAKTRLNLPE
jgi:hypothetical protein